MIKTKLILQNTEENNNKIENFAICHINEYTVTNDKEELKETLSNNSVNHNTSNSV